MVLATWSGQAIAAFRMLTGVLASEFHDCAIPVMLCDTDELTNDFVAVLGTQPQGYGETLWVKDRKIIGILLDYRTDHWADIVKTNTRMMVATKEKPTKMDEFYNRQAGSGQEVEDH
jgi:hypothetical protein